MTRKLGINWSDSPVFTAYSPPYAIALLPNFVEVSFAQHALHADIIAWVCWSPAAVSDLHVPLW